MSWIAGALVNFGLRKFAKESDKAAVRMAEERAEELKSEGHSDDCATLQGLDLMCQLESNYVDIMIRCNKHCSKCGI